MWLFLVSDKRLQTRPNQTGRKGHYTLTKGENSPTGTGILNNYPQTQGHQVHTLLQLKSHTDPHPIIVGDFNTPLSPTNKTDIWTKTKQRNPEAKYHKLSGPQDTSTEHAIYILKNILSFQHLLELFTNIEHILGHKTNLNTE